MARPKNFERNKGVNELARECSLSITTVSRKLRQGKTPDQIRQEAKDWHAKERKQKTPLESESFTAAQTRKERALADLRELELSTKRGELAPIGEINAWISGMILRARDILTRIAPELRDRLAKEIDPIRVQELIEAEITRALTQLAVFKGAQ